MPNLTELIQALANPGADARRIVVNALVEIGAPAVDPLIHALTDRNKYVLLGAMDALSEIGDLRAIGPLVQMFTYPDQNMSGSAVHALVKIGKAAVVPLIQFLGDPGFHIHNGTAYTLGLIGDPRAVEPLIQAFDHRDEILRRVAAEALAKIGFPAVDALTHALDAQEWRIRVGASEALGNMDDLRGVDGLIRVLADPDATARRTAATALGRLGDARAVEALVQLLSDPIEIVRIGVAHALGRIGDAKAVEPLIQTLADQEPGVRSSAAYALGRIGDAGAVEPLIQALADQESKVRSSAAVALGEIGDHRAIEPLTRALSDQDKINVRSRATDALTKIGGIANLIDALKHQNSGVRCSAARALGQPGNARAVEPLIQVLADPDEWVRSVAAESLGKIGDSRAVEPLIQALTDPGISKSPAYALAEIGDTRAVEPLIHQLLTNQSPRFRSSAAYALERLGDSRAVEPLIQVLGDSDECVRKSVAHALGKLGDARAVEPLIQMLDDIRITAVDALGEIGDPRAIEPLTRWLHIPRKYGPGPVSCGDERQSINMIKTKNNLWQWD